MISASYPGACLGSHSRDACPQGRLAGSPRRGSCEGQANRELRTLTNSVAARLQLASLLLNEPLGKGEAEAKSTSTAVECAIGLRERLTHMPK